MSKKCDSVRSHKDVCVWGNSWTPPSCFFTALCPSRNGCGSLLHPTSGRWETASAQVALWLSAISFYLLYCTLKSLSSCACVCTHVAKYMPCAQAQIRRELEGHPLSPQHVGSEDWTRWCQQQHFTLWAFPPACHLFNAQVPASQVISWEKSREKFTTL